MSIVSRISFLTALVLFSSGLANADPPAVLAPAPPSAKVALPHASWSFRDAGLIPVQSGGRVKPLDSFARELVLLTTTSRAYPGWNPVDLVFSWLVFPDYWQDQLIIRVNRADVRRQLQLDEKRAMFSPRELMSNFTLLQYAQQMPQSPPQDRGAVEKKSQRDEELRHVIDRIGAFRQVVSGDAWTVAPKPGDEAWGALTAKDDDGQSVRHAFVDVVRAYQADDQAKFEAAAASARSAVEAKIPGWNAGSGRVIAVEGFYNRSQPFQWAWIFYMLAAITWISSFAAPSVKWPRRLAGSLTGIAVAWHVAGIAMRCYIAGRPPVSNMYESVIWVSFGVVVFAAIIQFVTKQAIPLAVASVLAMFGLIAGAAAPAILDPGIHPLVPVLRSNYWLTIHVLTITLGYAAFALTLGLANVSLFHFVRRGQGYLAKISNTNQLTYRAMQFGVVLIAAGTILGGVWADYSWGRFWGWDPKEVWALIVLLSYVAILHGRLSGWIGQFAYAAWTVVAFLSVLMAWYGVNFILGVGLHSYGFSTGGFTGVMTFVAVQGAYVVFAAVQHARGNRAAKAARSVPGAAAKPVA